MTEKDVKFENRKLSLILNCLKEELFSQVYEELQSDKFTSIEEVDAYVDSQLRQYDMAIEQVKTYYTAKIEAQFDEAEYDDEIDKNEDDADS